MDFDESLEQRALAGTPHQGSETEAEESALAATSEIWARVQGMMLDRVAGLERATMALVGDTLDQDRRRLAEREAHELADSLGTYGFTLGTEWAREIEFLLKGDGRMHPSQVLRLSELVVALRPHLERPPADHPLRSAEPTQRMLMISDDSELVQRVATDSAARGLEVHRTTIVGLGDSLGVRPSIILLDVADDHNPEDALAILAAEWPEVPLLVISFQDSVADSVEGARWGSRAFLQKPAASSEILDAASQVLEQAASQRAKILIVVDDPPTLATLEAMLPAQGFAVVTHSDPLTFWTVLEDAVPDLLILDIDMAGLNAIEVCRMVRKDPRWFVLPVLLLTARTDAQTVSKVFAVRADDYIPKPLLGPELLSRIRNRLERTFLQRRLAETDPLTGMATRSKSERISARLLKLADRYNQSVCLAVLDVDQFKRINSREGHAAGDAILRALAQILRHAFRGEDIVARWGDEFVAVLYGMSRSDGLRRVTNILAAFQQKEFPAQQGGTFRASFSAGVAEYPTDGANVHELYRSADGAVSRARAAGSNRVLPAGWQGDRAPIAQHVDIVLVNDDEALTALLLHTLQIQGYSTHCLNDGHAAVEALCGREPPLRARIILLDVSLPSLDGFSVLRQLASDQILRRTKVIVLTARSLETEVLKALELGAFDHLAKPFSMPVLMQLLRRAMAP
jgi:diguanylate cyclase (GGDEF)-like protein